MTIEINRTGYCKDCPHFELITHTEWGYDLTVGCADLAVGCAHEDICDMWQERIEKARREKQEGEEG